MKINTESRLTVAETNISDKKSNIKIIENEELEIEAKESRNIGKIFQKTVDTRLANALPDRRTSIQTQLLNDRVTNLEHSPKESVPSQENI